MCGARQTLSLRPIPDPIQRQPAMQQAHRDYMRSGALIGKGFGPIGRRRRFHSTAMRDLRSETCAGPSSGRQEEEEQKAAQGHCNLHARATLCLQETPRDGERRRKTARDGGRCRETLRDPERRRETARDTKRHRETPRDMEHDSGVCLHYKALRK